MLPRTSGSGCASSQAFHQYIQICRSPLGLTENIFFCVSAQDDQSSCILRVKGFAPFSWHLRQAHMHTLALNVHSLL